LEQSLKVRVYRGDIQGLRAVAILLVVFAHAKVPGFSSGFVGVDVFFVLSGYLITGLLVEELSSSQFIAFAAFYARRFRRLLPSLVLVIVAGMAMAALVLPDAQLEDQTLSGAWAAVWLSNFHFLFADTDYFRAGSAANWFLHTWSLGVEEQFYLVWPALLWLAQRGCTSSSRLPRWRAVMLAILVVSLGTCVYLSARSPGAAFYLMPTRAWQFALGAMIVFRGDSIRDFTGARPIIRYAGIVGLALIVASAALLPSTIVYPGAWAVIPSVGAFLVILAGESRPDEGAGAFLSLPVMRRLGNVSYSWYLWHWPVLQFGFALGVVSLTGRCALAACSLMLATGTYLWVEKPTRANRRLVAKPAWPVGGAIALMIVVNAFAIRWNNQLRDLPVTQEDRQYRAEAVMVSAVYQAGCDDWYKTADVRVCAFGSSEAQHTAVVMGDSIALQWFPALAEIFSNKSDWRLLVLTKSSCPMVDESFFYERIGRNYDECDTWRRGALAEVARLKPDILVLGSTFTYPLGQTQWTEGTKRLLQAVAPSSGRVYLIRSTPVLPFDALACLTNHSVLYSALHTSSTRCTAPNVDAHGDDVFSWISASTRSFPNVATVDMSDVVCPASKCQALRDGTVVFRDNQHLAVSFARSLSDQLATRLEIRP